MNDDRLKPGERCASTSNRNFEGRQGMGGRTHLMSPAMAAAAAITGHLVDVRTLGASLTWKASHASRASLPPLPEADVDTDVIFPARFLLLLDKAGLGKHLFHERRYRDGKTTDFVLNRPPFDEAQDPGRRHAISARARAASRRCGRSPISAYAASSRRASAKSSTATASRTACCRSSSTTKSTRRS